MTATIRKYHILRKEVIKQLYYSKMLTLTELSSLSHKSLPLITSAVNDLVRDGYVLEHGLAPSSGGRRPLTFSLNPQKQMYIIAVAMDQLVTRMVIYDLLNKPQNITYTLPLNLVEDTDALTKLVQFIKSNIALSGIPSEQLLGVGIGMPGFVNAEQGVNHTFLKSTDEKSLKDYLKKSIGLPVFIENDSSLIAFAELKFGIGKGYDDIMVINIGWGIGLGMIINGNLFKGHNGYAGEFSHIPLSQSNKLCSCGKRGCLEVDTSLLVLVERARSEMANGISSSMENLFKDESRLQGDHFLDAARAGDPLALSILSDAAFLIGKGIATLIHIMNPELIVLSGRGAAAGKFLMAPIQQAINEFCIPRLADHTEIKVSNLASQSELLGAATLVVENCDFA
ncbi:ROK family protein [Pedobacter panaciterrae]|jgi:Transcriptional regulator/sugar kinase|uniref:ROK family protein n=1 Tax=Pedobacter panaciterrae TaxID=363849 RepID=A0ABU8NUX0_9SPHI|nr:ROK family protein [Pedobacter panaciterrae]